MEKWTFFTFRLLFVFWVLLILKRSQIWMYFSYFYIICTLIREYLRNIKTEKILFVRTHVIPQVSGTKRTNFRERTLIKIVASHATMRCLLRHQSTTPYCIIAIVMLTNFTSRLRIFFIRCSGADFLM